MTVPILLARGSGDQLVARQDELHRKESWVPENTLMELALHSSQSFLSILEAAASAVNTATDLVEADARAEVDREQAVLRVYWRKGQPWLRVVLQVILPFLVGVAIGILISSWRFVAHVALGWVLAVLVAVAAGFALPELIRRSVQSEGG